MTRRIRSCTALVLGAVSSLVLVTSAALSAEPLPLSNEQLDRVTAGFLAINVAADAQAVSELASTFTNTVTSTNISVGQPQEDGYIYTTGNGTAAATAIGQAGYTAVGGNYDTNQEVVHVEVSHGAIEVAVRPNAPEQAAHWVQAEQQRQHRLAERRAAQDQRIQERRTRAAAHPASERRIERRQERQAQQDQRISDRRERQDERLASRADQREQRRLQQLSRHDERERLRAANAGVAPVLLQHQVLDITVITRRPVNESLQ